MVMQGSRPDEPPPIDLGEFSMEEDGRTLLAPCLTFTLYVEGIDGEDPNGLKPGDRVSVVPDDYGVEKVSGALVRTSAQAISLLREDASVGEVIVHFPRVGYRIRRD